MQAVLIEHARADSARAQVTPLTDEQKPPRLAADEKSARATISAEDLERINDVCDALAARLDRVEARRDAERKLTELEDALERTGIAPEEHQPIKLN
jgi:hypothetical protein